MLRLCVKAENKKLRHSVIWAACILIPIIPAIMGTFNYQQNLGILTGKWYSLWSQLSLFYACFFYAPLIALYCSYLWRLEHLNHNWNVLMTAPVSIPGIFFSKLAVILKVTVITQVWLAALFLICGKLIGLPGWVPSQILIWILRGTLAAMAIGTLQLLLSMCIRSFSVPIGIALGGGVAGLIISNKGLGLYWPYALMLMGMNSNKNEDTLAGQSLFFFLSVLLFFLAFSGISIFLLKKRDVKA